jgi:hypothetical protein
VVDAAVTARRAPLDAAWSAAADGETTASLEARLRPPLEAITSDVLDRLYPSRA